MDKKIKVCMTSLGCCKNLVDAERMLFLIRKAGYELVTEPGLSDVSVINTCGFIQSAKEEAIETILESVTLKNEGRIRSVIVTGCLSERYQDEAAELFPEADAVIGIGCCNEIAEIIAATLRGERVVKFPPKDALPVTGERIISTLPFFAYLKIAEGCDNCCSYCAIPQIRGRFRSVPIDDVLAEAKWLCDNGVKEIIVVAQDTTRYGEDIKGGARLPELLTRLCAIEGLKWLRVLYCYPERITDELIDVIAREPKIVKYFDIPIQHCNGEILRDMNRAGNEAELETLLTKIRERIPDAVLRTTLITGFPGESEEQFTELCEFVKKIGFDRLGCFPYSEEEGTIAAEMPKQVDEEVRARRAEIIMDEQNIISARHNEQMLGRVTEAVVEGFDKWAECFFGRTAADAPDIDGKIFFTCGDRLKVGQFVNVRVTDTLDYDLIGEVTDENESAE